MTEELKRPIKEKLIEVLNADLDAQEAQIALSRKRDELQQLMEEQKVGVIDVTMFKPDGMPDVTVSARLDPVVKSEVDVNTVEETLTAEQKAPFTKFNITISKLEGGLKKGTFGNDEEVLRILHGCIKRIPTGKSKLVVKGIPKVMS